MSNNKLRCVHRHTIEEHPKCFLRGLIRSDNKKENKTEQKISSIEEKPLAWYQQPGIRIGYFDIETDNLNADFGTVLSWAIKEKGGKVHYDYITKKDIDTGVFDGRIVESFLETLKDFDIIVGYYSTGFDFPYMRAKALRYNLGFPGYGELYHWDLYYTVRSKLKISRKSLDNACDYLGIVGKTPLDKNIWRLAKYADPKAIQEVVKHNIGDVEITEQLHDRLSFTRKWIKRSV